MTGIRSPAVAIRSPPSRPSPGRRATPGRLHDVACAGRKDVQGRHRRHSPLCPGRLRSTNPAALAVMHGSDHQSVPHRRTPVRWRCLQLQACHGLLIVGCRPHALRVMRLTRTAVNRHFSANLQVSSLKRLKRSPARLRTVRREFLGCAVIRSSGAIGARRPRRAMEIRRCGHHRDAETRPSGAVRRRSPPKGGSETARRRRRPRCCC